MLVVVIIIIVYYFLKNAIIIIIIFIYVHCASRAIRGHNSFLQLKKQYLTSRFHSEPRNTKNEMQHNMLFFTGSNNTRIDYYKHLHTSVINQ